MKLSFGSTNATNLMTNITKVEWVVIHPDFWQSIGGKAPGQAYDLALIRTETVLG